MPAGDADAVFMALVAVAVRDPTVRSYLAALLDRCGLSTAEREAIWRSFEAAALGDAHVGRGLVPGSLDVAKVESLRS
jgi:hypothetical protein